MIRRLRLAATAILFAAAGALPLITATPAHADTASCSAYLADAGVAGDQTAACDKGAAGDVTGCTGDLVGAGVARSTALEACVMAVQS
ncbi:hypothetical protein [Streptomyces sp. B6B3]|uniref:hypothetical protein n=1 Tax=Streptomyces sp. B6B3 TaxID=3153570 RepID=UPI00325CAE7A